MYELVWKEILSDGNKPIRHKSFRTEERRADFINRMAESGTSFEITSMNSADSHTLSDFQIGMRVRIEKALHADYIGRIGTVIKTVKRDTTVKIRFDDGTEYRSFAWNLEIA